MISHGVAFALSNLKSYFLFLFFSFSHKSQCYKNLLLAFTDYFARLVASYRHLLGLQTK
ncbi:hypothetical protein WN944_021002 [Citrus x changshan-huyou]|uniref:Uncharacterized protein n=1 Tax=Citrus x changshan-huyou TaxID=2935761 RepID=A0AAP0MW05_9ROSI